MVDRGVVKPRNNCVWRRGDVDWLYCTSRLPFPGCVGAVSGGFSRNHCVIQAGLFCQSAVVTGRCIVLQQIEPVGGTILPPKELSCAIPDSALRQPQLQAAHSLHRCTPLYAFC